MSLQGIQTLIKCWLMKSVGGREDSSNFGAASEFCHLFSYVPPNMVMVVDEEVPSWHTEGQLGVTLSFASQGHS